MAACATMCVSATCLFYFQRKIAGFFVPECGDPPHSYRIYICAVLSLNLNREKVPKSALFGLLFTNLLSRHFSLHSIIDTIVIITFYLYTTTHLVLLGPSIMGCGPSRPAHQGSAAPPQPSDPIQLQRVNAPSSHSS